MSIGVRIRGRARIVAALWVAVIAGAAVATVYAQRGGRVAQDRALPISVVTRESLEGKSSVLFDLPGRRIDQIVAQLPADKPLTAGHVPDGWKLDQRGREIRLNGPATTSPSFRLDGAPGTQRDYTGRDANVRVGIDGRLEPSARVTIGSLDKVSTTGNLEGILTLPPNASPGQPLMIGVVPDYRRGQWTLLDGTRSMPLVSLDDIDNIEVIKSKSQTLYGDGIGGVIDAVLRYPAPQPFISMFPEQGTFNRVQFVDRFGELAVDAPLNFTIVPVPSVCQRSLTGGSPLTFTGQAACVSGCFPDVTSAYGLMLDGMTELMPWAVSPTTVMLGIPEGTTPGPHTVSLPGGSSSITIGVVTMQGSIDQNRLWRGESTTMRLRVLGTDERFPLTILNRTPAIIDIEGGVYQSVSTPGGADNAITRNVRGIQKGNFTIHYTVASKGCAGG